MRAVTDASEISHKICQVIVRESDKGKFRLGRSSSGPRPGNVGMYRYRHLEMLWSIECSYVYVTFDDRGCNRDIQPECSDSGAVFVSPPGVAMCFPQTKTLLHAPNLKVNTNKLTYAAILNAVKIITTFPLVLNFFLPKPSSPTSLKNCLFPCCLLYALTTSTPAP